MNTKHISLAALAIVAVLAGCTKNPIETPSDSNRFADLELTSVNSVQTKAAIDGTTFPTDGEIGLFLFKDEAADTPYGESGYTNVKYSYNSTKGKWTANPSIKVGSTPGYLYGYYPYNSASTDVKAIPVVSSLNGDDVMYATSQTVTDKTASQTTITMNHALARVAVTVVNKGYTGAAKLSSIKFVGAETSAAGTLDALNGNITATKADVTLDVPAACQDITAAGATYDCLLVPSKVETGRQDVTLTLTINGQEKTANLSSNNGVIIARNTKSNITITLSNSGISVQTVSVEDWNVVEIGGYKVTIKVADGVDPNDILTKAYVDGNSVIVRAYSYSGQHLKCTMPDGEFCSSQSKTSNMAYTFTLSDITEDTTATIGYAKELSISVSPENSGTVEITGEAYEGETAALKAIPAYKYGFDAWLDKDGNPLSCEEETYSNVRLSSGCMSVKFKENLILDGVFSIADDHIGNVRKVRFTRGNLYLEDYAECKIEQRQYEYGTSFPSYPISHFMWCNNISDAVQQRYEDAWYRQEPFFTETSFSVSGFSENQCRTLTNEEWQYLFSYGFYANDARRDKYLLGVEVCGNENCVVLLPDNWIWGSNENKKEYNYVEWKHMEAAGAVCLPAAGYRDGENSSTTIENANVVGYYWSTTPYGESAYYLYFNYYDVYLDHKISRGMAESVRLVVDVK